MLRFSNALYRIDVSRLMREKEISRLCRLNSTLSSNLKSARIVMRKRFGQHLLKNPDVVSTIVSLANINPSESVFEIGPGTGNLTLHLLRQAQHVYACELDSRLLEVLLKRVDEIDQSAADSAAKFESSLGLCTNLFKQKLTVVHDDFLRVPLPRFDVLVANIPYQISSPVLRRLFSLNPAPKRAIVMFQLEFAQRMVASPGTADYCRLSVNCQMLADCEIVLKVGKEQFRPPPKIDSAVVRISPKNIESTLRPRNLFENGSSFEEWDAFLRILFASKNKMLRTVLTRSKPALLRLTSLRNGSGIFTDEDVEKSKVDLEQTLLSTETTNLRANAMTLAQFRILFDALFKVGFRFSEKGLKKNESQEGIEGKKIESQEGIEGLFSPPTSLDDAVEPTMWKSMVEKLAVERSMKKGNPISATAQPNNIDNTPGENNDDESGFTLESTRSVNVLKGRASEDARRRERKKRARDILSIYEINIKRDHTN
jgi:18S rRNA (adenine1779-N6/adenine1780-N6)-dimethyltransferase